MRITLLAALLLITAGLVPVSADVLYSNFTASPLSGVTPLNVQFNDHSTGCVTSWLWYFGDGTSTNLQNPLHQYGLTGNFTVSLTVANSSGSDTMVRAGYIQVTNPPPVAAFSATPLNGPVPLPVQFNDLSTGVITSYLWDFGDGNTSTSSDPLHPYTAPGSYNVSLTVGNDGGSDTYSIPSYITVTNAPPTASFSANLTAGNSPLHVLFTDTSSGVDITGWSWTFGDGGTSTASDPLYVYHTPGTYSVSLMVENDGGNSTRIMNDYIRVFEQVPQADFIAVPTSGGEPLPVQFYDTTLGNHSTWLWQFGDGQSSSMQSPAHTYQNPGAYTVSLTSGNSGGTNTTTKVDYIQVSQRIPVADFSGTPTSGSIPLTVNFTDLSTGTPTSWLWSFGDGNTSTSRNPSHQYAFPGVFTVNLTVSNSYGTDTMEKAQYITTGEHPHADFNVTSTSLYTNQYVVFHDLSTGEPTEYIWDFGDGSTSTYMDPWHWYAEPGNFTVSLTVTNPFGSDTELKTDYLTVTPHPPEADFNAWPMDGSFPLTVTFQQWSYGGYYENLSYEWDFGDGSPNSTSPDYMVVHTYMNSGVYTVILTVSADGLSDTVVRENFIGTQSPPPPVAEFTASPRSGDLPLTVSFIDQTSGSPLITYGWDFGDGMSSTEKNPVHAYASAGTYNVTLTATNGGGSSVESKDGYIIVGAVAPLNADFASNVTNGTVPLTVQFLDASEGNPSSWSWYFESGYYYVLDGEVMDSAYPYSGGQVSSEKNPVVTYNSPGNYSVTLTVSRTGETDTIEKVDYIQVSPPPPVADFYAYPTEGPAPLMVEFDAYTSWWYYNDEWIWDFGDGSGVTEDYPWVEHLYQNPGLYNVTLTVNSPYGSDTTTKVQFINVTQVLPPEPAFVATPLSGNAPLEVSFTDTSAGTVTSRLWDFGDGTSAWANATTGVTHVYSLPESYSVSLTVGNAGGQATEVKPDYITVNPFGPPPVASFSLSPSIGSAPLTVSFTDLSRGMPSRWEWNFGDGSGSSLQNPVHTYTAPGKYSATLTVYNSGGSNSLSRTVWVTAPRSPIAFFITDRTMGFAPLTVHFTDRSVGSPISWAWNFGDGSSSSQKNPTHTYTASGTYSAVLTVQNAAGSSTTSRRIYVR
ncbi:MAG: PKD domain-containing protein [Methanolinea sp.]|nr:PKD domain-containing protein [Methanolinea sp.]